MNYHSSREIVWTPEMNAFILRNKNLSCRAIAKALGFPSLFSAVSRQRKHLGISTDLTLNESVFEDLSRTSAYLLGWFITDGSMTYDDRHCDLEFTVSPKDREHLKVLAKGFSTNHKIYDYKTYSKLRFSSKKLCQDLVNLGIPPHNKSVTEIKFKVSKSHFNDFLRGFTDGDGSVFIHKGYLCWSIYQSKTQAGLISQIRDLIMEVVGVDLPININNLCSISCSGSKAEKICEFIYSNHPELFLNRKYLIYQLYKSNYAKRN